MNTRVPLRRHLAAYPLTVPLNRPSPTELSSLSLFVLIQAGRLYLKLPGASRLVAGPAFLSAAAGTVSRLRTDGSSGGYVVVADVGFLSHLIAPFLEAAGASDLVAGSGLSVINVHRDCAQKCMAAMERIEEETLEKHSGWRETAVLLLGGILVDAHRDRESGDDGSSRAYIPVEDLPEHIKSHYSEEFSLNGLAKVCNTSPGALSRAFKEVAGVPLFSFINDIRIEKACGLLKRTNMTVLEVAFAVGYNNVSFFNRYFRRLTGSSPSEYRKSVKS